MKKRGMNFPRFFCTIMQRFPFNKHHRNRIIYNQNGYETIDLIIFCGAVGLFAAL